MLPMLYAETANYGMTYLGTLNRCTKCKVTEVRNGAYTLSLETTINDACADLIFSQRVIRAKANPFDEAQYFEIQSTERTFNGMIKAEATHIKHLAFQICSEGDLTQSSTGITGTPEAVWEELNSRYITTSVPFNFLSNISSAKTFSLGLNVAETLGNILGGKKGSFLDTWGGEYHWDNFRIRFLQSRGKESGYQIRYGANISDARQNETCESTYTHILPHGMVSKGDRKMHVFSPLYQIPNSQSNYTKVFLLDCTDILEEYSVGEHGENYDTVRTVMNNYAIWYAYANRLGKLDVNISVTLRAELDEMVQIGLCDTVNVILDNFGTTNVNAKITEAVYDSLLERWDKLVIGEARVTVADMILKNRTRS